MMIMVILIIIIIVCAIGGVVATFTDNEKEKIY